MLTSFDGLPERDRHDDVANLVANTEDAMCGVNSFLRGKSYLLARAPYAFDPRGLNIGQILPFFALDEFVAVLQVEEKTGIALSWHMRRGLKLEFSAPRAAIASCSLFFSFGSKRPTRRACSHTSTTCPSSSLGVPTLRLR
jgi:hypothetical protein